MRIAVLLLLLTSLLSCRENKSHTWPDSDVGRHKVYGRVKHLKETSYSVNNAGKKVNATLIITNRFDTSGNCIEFSVDADFDPGLMPVEHRKESLRYNHFGKLAVTETINGDVFEKHVRAYDALGKLIYSEFFVDGKLKRKHRYVCNYEDKILVDSSFNSCNFLQYITGSEYNEFGDIIRSYDMDSSGMVTKNIVYRYDKYRNLIQERTTDLLKHSSSRYEYTYNEDGNEVEHVLYVNGRRMYRTSLRYEQVDAIGNWRVRKEHLDGKFSEIMEREIDYW